MLLRVLGSARLARLLASLAVAAGVALSVPAIANALRLGTVAPPDLGGCSSCSVFQVTTAPGERSYKVPKGRWQVTSWSAQGGGTADGEARLLVFRRTAAPGQAQADRQEPPGNCARGWEPELRDERRGPGAATGSVSARSQAFRPATARRTRVTSRRLWAARAIHSPWAKGSGRAPHARWSVPLDPRQCLGQAAAPVIQLRRAAKSLRMGSECFPLREVLRGRAALRFSATVSRASIRPSPSRNGNWAGSGDFAGSCRRGKGQCGKNNIGRPGHRHLCDDDTALFVPT